MKKETINLAVVIILLISGCTYYEENNPVISQGGTNIGQVAVSQCI